MKEIFLGILASMFFAVTFILNRSMELSGGSWMWSSSLRFFFMVPFLLLIVLLRGNLKQLFIEIKRRPVHWFVWSFVGFVLFYAPITYAAAYGPGWLVAGTWQIVVVTGVLLGPLFYHTIETENGPLKVRHKIPLRALAISSLIFFGVVFIQFQQASDLTLSALFIGVVPVIIAALAYPLGNRKMMDICDDKLDTFQRVLGMTICTIPCWILIAMIGYYQVGAPQSAQLLQTFIVAISSGVIATLLFFVATNRVRNDHSKLAAVEATQSVQVVFVVVGEVFLLSSPLPNGIATLGLMIIIIGITAHSYYSNKEKSRQKQPIINKAN